jgi:hypothetical protein
MRAGCFQLSDITFLKTYPTLAQLLPPDHRPPPPEVNTTNANLGARAKAALRDHPRVVRGRHAHPAMPTEGAFASMHEVMACCLMPKCFIARRAASFDRGRVASEGSSPTRA